MAWARIGLLRSRRSFTEIFAITILFLFPTAGNGQSTVSNCPRLEIDLDLTKTWRPDPTLDFHIQINPAQASVVPISIPRDPSYDLESTDSDAWSSSSGGPLIIAAGGRRSIRLKLRGENPGILRFQAKPEAPWPVLTQGGTPMPCPGMNVLIDTGFSQDAEIGVEGAEFHCDCQNIAGTPQGALDINSTRSLTVYFRKRDGSRVILPEPVTIILTSPDTQISKTGREWDHKDVPVTMPRSGKDVVFIRPVSWSGTGLVTAKVAMAQGGSELFQCRIWYNARVPWWALLLGTFFGSLLYVGVDEVLKAKADLGVLRKNIENARGASFVVAVLTGALAYFARDVDVWGIKIQADTFRGAAILGFVAATIGLAAIFDKLRQVFGPQTPPVEPLEPTEGKKN